MRRNIVIIHFNPLELYPPVQNFLNYLARQKQENDIHVFTTNTTFSALERFEVGASNIHIHRLGSSGKSLAAPVRYFNYLFFYLVCILKLILIKPLRILYFETISGYPAYIYKRVFNNQVGILIHYHEYTSLKEYKSGMKLTRYFHKLEKYFYSRNLWISHTNKYRMDRFTEDVQPITIINKHILPNYPPKSWYQQPVEELQIPVKIVYAGSMGLDTMYVAEFTRWVIEQNGKVTWDIYSYNISPEAKTFLEANRSEFIYLKAGVNYSELPLILKNYNVGVILYKGHIENYIYNAPNKLFEYLDCGLDVWFPNIMSGTLDYITNNVYPKVISLDFMNLNNFNLSHTIDRNNFTYNQQGFFCEDVLEPLSKKLLDV